MCSRAIFALLVALLLGACADSSQTRPDRARISDNDMAAISASAFEQLKSKNQLSADYEAYSLVRCVSDHLVAELAETDRALRWETVVFEDASALLYALPGGKLGVHRGLLQVTPEEAQLAAAIAHELGHIAQRHVAERVSAEFALEAAVAAAQTYRGKQGPEPSKQLYALLGLGTQVGEIRPFSDAQELAADSAGLRLLARAGYPADAAPALWQTLAEQASAQTASWLASHPQPARRANALRLQLAAVRPDEEAAQAAGRQPHCR